MSSRRAIDVPVLIVGGGPAGLCASILLSSHGIESLLVEKHPGTSIYPRATGDQCQVHGDIPVARVSG